MISYYKTIQNHLIACNAPEAGCWVSVIDPTAQERKMLIEHFGLDSDFIKSALDEEESSRVEREDTQTLIIVDTAVSEIQKNDTIVFYTMPMSIIIKDQLVFTISLRENKVLEDIVDGRLRNVQTSFRTQFVLRLIMQLTSTYLVYLKQIDKASNALERELHKAVKNKQLLQMMELEKSLVYFSTSLKANDATMNKILRGKLIKLYEDDQDLLEDVLIELKQAEEMASIYSSILANMVDACSSVISNNVNIVMWQLTIVTIILAIPTMVFSFYGMNTLDLPFAEHTWFPTGIAIAATVLTAFILLKYKKK
ncbi:MAG: magnesium transporter CorA family protein [Oscillospiraceae bacterium]|nr:magnesium transporter CorA family protein [Oscillospiraceae bacterium]